MNLGPRCNAMLANSTQCPNTALADSKYCKLHELNQGRKLAEHQIVRNEQINSNPDKS